VKFPPVGGGNRHSYRRQHTRRAVLLFSDARPQPGRPPWCHLSKNGLRKQHVHALNWHMVAKFTPLPRAWYTSFRVIGRVGRAHGSTEVSTRPRSNTWTVLRSDFPDAHPVRPWATLPLDHCFRHEIVVVSRQQYVHPHASSVFYLRVTVTVTVLNPPPPIQHLWHAVHGCGDCSWLRDA